jgi:hypothetical protein
MKCRNNTLRNYYILIDCSILSSISFSHLYSSYGLKRNLEGHGEHFDELSAGFVEPMPVTLRQAQCDNLVNAFVRNS